MKYAKGDKILSFPELWNQKKVFYGNVVVGEFVIKHWPYKFVIKNIDSGKLRKAVPERKKK